LPLNLVSRTVLWYSQKVLSRFYEIVIQVMGTVSLS